MCHRAPEPAPASGGVTQRAAPPEGPDPASGLPPAPAGPCQVPRRAPRRLSEPAPVTEVAFLSPAAHCLVCLSRSVSDAELEPFGTGAVSSHVNVRFPRRRALMWSVQEHLLLQQQCPGTDASQTGSPPLAAALLPALGPAASLRQRARAAGHDVPFLGDPLGPGLGSGACRGDRHQLNAASSLGTGKALPRAPAAPTAARARTGAGRALRLGTWRLCPRGRQRLGCSRRLEPRGCSQCRGMRSCRCPGATPAAHGRQVRSGRWPRGSGTDPSGWVVRGVG